MALFRFRTVILVVTSLVGLGLLAGCIKPAPRPCLPTSRLGSSSASGSTTTGLAAGLAIGDSYNETCGRWRITALGLAPYLGSKPAVDGAGVPSLRFGIHARLCATADNTTNHESLPPDWRLWSSDGKSFGAWYPPNGGGYQVSTIYPFYPLHLDRGHCFSSTWVVGVPVGATFSMIGFGRFTPQRPLATWALPAGFVAPTAASPS
jgi:hypothetical protein